jgi:hypothetical protein
VGAGKEIMFTLLIKFQTQKIVEQNKRTLVDSLRRLTQYSRHTAPSSEQCRIALTENSYTLAEVRREKHYDKSLFPYSSGVLKNSLDIFSPGEETRLNLACASSFIYIDADLCRINYFWNVTCM